MSQPFAWRMFTRQWHLVGVAASVALTPESERTDIIVAYIIRLTARVLELEGRVQTSWP